MADATERNRRGYSRLLRKEASPKVKQQAAQSGRCAACCCLGRWRCELQLSDLVVERIKTNQQIGGCLFLQIELLPQLLRASCIPMRPPILCYDNGQPRVVLGMGIAITEAPQGCGAAGRAGDSELENHGLARMAKRELGARTGDLLGNSAIGRNEMNYDALVENVRIIHSIRRRVVGMGKKDTDERQRNDEDQSGDGRTSRLISNDSGTSNELLPDREVEVNIVEYETDKGTDVVVQLSDRGGEIGHMTFHGDDEKGTNEVRIHSGRP